MSATFDPVALDARYQFAREAAKQAAEIGHNLYLRRAELITEHKGDDLQDVVSIADREVENYLKGAIRERFPEDGFLGEESGLESGRNGVLWIVDPIDGTACFLNGLHNWCTSVGVLIDGQPVIGAISDPNHGETFHACKGVGAFVNDTPIRASQAGNVREGVLGVGTSHRVRASDFVPFIEGLLEAGGMFVRTGSGALMMAHAAAGRLIGYYEPHINSWDCLAGIVLMHEAGGRSNDFFAGDGLLKGNPILVAPEGLYPQLVSLIGNTSL